MQKVLCIIGMVCGILVLLLFLSDLILYFAGMNDISPLKGFSLLLDCVFTLGGGGLAVVSFYTFREQVERVKILNHVDKLIHNRESQFLFVTQFRIT